MGEIGMCCIFSIALKVQSSCLTLVTFGTVSYCNHLKCFSNTIGI